MAWLDSSLQIIVPFDTSLRIDFVHDPALNFSNFLLVSFICSPCCRMASWDTLSTRRSISNCGFSQHLAQNLAQVSLCEFDHLSSLIPVLSWTSFLVQITSSLIDCYCWDCLLFLSVTFGAARGVESLSNNIRCPFLRKNCRHRTVYNDCVWLRLPELHFLILCSG